MKARAQIQGGVLCPGIRQVGTGQARGGEAAIMGQERVLPPFPQPLQTLI